MKKLTKKLLWSAFAVSLILPGFAQEDDSKLNDLMNEGEDLVNLEEGPAPEPEIEAAKKLAPPTPQARRKPEPTAADTSVEDFLGVDAVTPGSNDLTSAKASITDDTPEEFLGLEEKILPDLKGHQRFTPPNMHEVPELNVAPEAVVIDKPPFKGQTHSLIPWATLDADDWFSYETWLTDRDTKDKNPLWLQRMRDNMHAEIVGKVLQCKGTCKLYRGSISSSIQYLSRVHEGDEIHTSDDSEVWIYLMDGTLTRIGPRSSVSFQEINFSAPEIFYLVRLNHGHIFWHPRDATPLAAIADPETDALALPLQLRGANQEAFARAAFKQKNDRGHLDETYNLDDGPILAQISEVNALRDRHFQIMSDLTRFMLVTPTVTLSGRKASFDAVYMMGGDTYFKRRNALPESEFKAQKRGYRDSMLTSVEGDQWWQTAELGRRIGPMAEVPAQLQVSELITKRIRTLELAREMWFQKFTLPMVPFFGDVETLSSRFGYLTWQHHIFNRRIDFLLEYTRRMETTNLRSIENLMVKMEERGDKFPRTLLSDDLYRAAVNRYLLGLKTRNMSHRTQVREMNDLQYYVWILRQGKL